MSLQPRHSRVGLLTFGGGLGAWRGAANRLAKQGQRSGWFTQVIAVTDKDLHHSHPNFTQAHRAILNRRTRGFGYWIWKPYLIQHFLHSWHKDVDLLLYLDAGHEINYAPAASLRFWDYCDMAFEGRNRFAMHLTSHSDAMWSKGDVHEFFALSEQDIHAPQLQASPFLATTSDHNVAFAQEWLEACTYEGYRLLDDTVSATPNADGFLGHRHDQAIFSALAKVKGVDSIADETYWAPNWQDMGRRFPLWAARNRSRVSLREQSWLGRKVRNTERLASRVLEEVTWRRASHPGQ